MLQQLVEALQQLTAVLQQMAGTAQASAGAATLGMAPANAGAAALAEPSTASTLAQPTTGGASGGVDPEVATGGGGSGAPPDAAAAPGGDNGGRSLQPLGQLTPDQFESEIGPSAACGPAAVVAFARFVGKDLSVTEVTRAAQELGLWNESEGMQGPEAQLKLLQHFGIKAHLEDPDWDKAKATVAGGQPVIMNLPGHYWVAEQYRAEDGKFNFGNSGSVFKGVEETWYDEAGMQAVQTSGGGAPMRKFIYLDPQ